MKENVKVIVATYRKMGSDVKSRGDEDGIAGKCIFLMFFHLHLSI